MFLSWKGNSLACGCVLTIFASMQLFSSCLERVPMNVYPTFLRPFRNLGSNCRYMESVRLL